MKTERKFRNLLAIALMLIVTASQAVAFVQERVEIVITRQTTKTELNKMIKDYKNQGIDITLEDVKYDGKDRVRSIKGNVNFNDGNAGSFEAVRLKRIVIIRDYRAEAEKPFDILINPKDNKK
jgi:hypothetical protein